ncbi:DUF3576 domain-containing protein [Palleronia sediminis]|uniref:DUF3576 domain-containing protein n=1 Tax=Palleronia sediminis TaxID=2547833 RepID=A0A4R6A6K2_9RHOB|nr:DUF3576 domain-containing protein [Palleronia sediminis]TDL78392.1 DUF3576 domain-containing protein [Palleronia sediminis]
MTATPTRIGFCLAAAAALAACSNRGPATNTAGVSDNVLLQRQNTPIEQRRGRETIFDLFLNADDPNVTVEVNRYIWNASLQVLDFLPLETADPFTGVLVFGFGRPPGGGQAYRATVYVQDPALDARSLNVAVASTSGPVSVDTARAIEDAILTRARQLRVADAAL